MVPQEQYSCCLTLRPRSSIVLIICSSLVKIRKLSKELFNLLQSLWSISKLENKSNFKN